jgi:D-alanine--poly(phosphoribitol) ligase subunit 2
MAETTVTEARIAEVILRTLTDLDEQGVVALEGEQVGPDTELFGESGLLDSVGLVSLVVAVEQELEDELGVHVGLADERALSQRSSPYRTVGTLAGYAAGLVPAG